MTTVAVYSADESAAGLAWGLQQRGFDAGVVSRLATNLIAQPVSPVHVHWPPWANSQERTKSVYRLNRNEVLRAAIANELTDKTGDRDREFIWFFDGERFLEPGIERLLIQRMQPEGQGPEIDSAVVALRVADLPAPPSADKWTRILTRPSVAFSGPIVMTGDSSAFYMGLLPDEEAALFDLARDTRGLLDVQRLDFNDRYAIAVHISVYPWPASPTRAPVALPRGAWRHYWPRNLHLHPETGGFWTQTGDLGCVTARSYEYEPGRPWPLCGAMDLACNRLQGRNATGAGRYRGGTLDEMMGLIDGLQFRSDFAHILRKAWPESFAPRDPRSINRDEGRAPTPEPVSVPQEGDDGCP